MTTDTEALVRRAYHLAEGDVLDIQGFIDLFAADGVFTGIGGVSGPESYRGEQLGDVLTFAQSWLLQHSPNIMLIPGTSSVAHLRENIAGAGLTLPDDAVAELAAI